MTEEISDRDRYPTLSPTGERIINFMREHPAAPIYRNQSGNRLTAADIEDVRHFDREVANMSPGWKPAGHPDWLQGFASSVFGDVPYYRALGSLPRRFEDIPTITRAELSQDIAQFVPGSVAIDRLINFRTTGTTGHPLLIASHPQVAARYLTFHRRALRKFGIELTHGTGQVGVVLVGYQRKCFTYVSVTPLMDESGLAKVNLHPKDWHDPEDRARYLDALAPEIYAGDPISFAELATLPLRKKPRALISVSMALSLGLRQNLEKRFECPVVDVYSLNESGPVAVWDPVLNAWPLLQPRLFVEILGQDGAALENGRRGEITLTGGFNFCLPLLRYRTGDFGSLSHGVEGPMIHGLAGRRPVRFRTTDGVWMNNIDVTHALDPLALPQFGLHQAVDGSLILSVAPSSLSLGDAARAALMPLFGNQKISVKEITSDDKTIQYTSDVNGATL